MVLEQYLGLPHVSGIFLLPQLFLKLIMLPSLKVLLNGPLKKKSLQYIKNNKALHLYRCLSLKSPGIWKQLIAGKQVYFQSFFFSNKLLHSVTVSDLAEASIQQATFYRNNDVHIFHIYRNNDVHILVICNKNPHTICMRIFMRYIYHNMCIRKNCHSFPQDILGQHQVIIFSL